MTNEKNNLKHISKLSFIGVIAIIYLTAITHSLIIPDNTNPLLLNRPSPNKTGYKLSLSFALSGETRLTFGQYLGVVFPKYTGDQDLLLNSYHEVNLPGYTYYKPKYSCELEDLTNLLSIIVESFPPKSPSENNIAYCILRDKDYSLTTNVNYKLTIIFDYIALSSNLYLPSVGLILTTSNDNNKIVIDSLPVIGSIGQYQNWETSSSPALTISNVDVNILTGTGAKTGSTILYPYNYFDLKVNLSVKQYIFINEVYIIVKFPTKAVTLPTGVITSAINTNNANSAALEGVIVLSPFEADSLKIEGITENLYSGREFQLTFKEIRALDNILAQTQLLEVFVYYKNTYSVLSYSSSAAFYITQAQVNLSSINHYESVDIFQHGLWPMRFVFSVNSELADGGYFLLQHTNAKDGNNRLNFVASTCDFSENLINTNNYQVDSSDINVSDYGKRPICHPLTNDFDYPGATKTAEYAGSGIFFKIPKIKVNKNYYLTVWIMAEECGTYNVLQSDANKVKFGFTMTVYKYFDPYAIGVERLKFTNNVLLAQSLQTMMTNSCYGTLLFKQSTYEKQPEEDADIPSYLLYQEYTDLEIIKTSKSCVSDCYLNDITNEFNKLNLYYNQDIVSMNEKIYPLIESTFEVKKDDFLSSKFPFPMNYNFDDSIKLLQGKIRVLFSKPFFTEGSFTSEGKCYLSWGFKLANVSTSTKNLSAYDVSITTKNYILSNATPKPTLDMSKSELPSGGPKSMFKLESIFSSDETAIQYLGNDYSKKCTIANSSGCKGGFALYTNCLHWKSKAFDTTLDSNSDSSSNSIGNMNKIDSVKSLFFYFETSFQFIYMADISDSGSPQRVVRLLKLFPESGFFNDPSISEYKYTKQSNKISSNLFTFHTSFGASSATNVICVIQFNFESISKYISYDSSTNLLTFFLFNLNLIDGDITDVSSIYPIVNDNNSRNIVAYGYNSQYLISTSNNLNSYYFSSNDNRLSQEKTHYTFYFGSIIQFPKLTDLTSSSKQTDYLIPVYCPRKYEANLNLPVISALLTRLEVENSNSDNTIVSEYTDDESTYSNQIKKFSYNLKIFKIHGNENYRSIQIVPENLIKYTNVVSSVVPATLRFNSYLTDSRNDQVNVFLGGVNRTNSNYLPKFSSYTMNKLSCVVWLVHDSLTIKASNYKTEIVNKNSGNTFLYQNKYNPSILSTNKGINVHGKFFTRIYITIIDPTLNLTSDDDVKSVENYSDFSLNKEEKQNYKGFEQSGFSLISGPVRPEIANFLNVNTGVSVSKELNKEKVVVNETRSLYEKNIPGYIPLFTQDLIGFYSCFTGFPDANNFTYTNFISDQRNLNSVYHFLLDFNPYLASTNSFTQDYFGIDILTDEFLYSDKGAGIRFEYTLPVFYSQAGYIRFTSHSSTDVTSSMFNPNTVCGIYDDEQNYADECFNQTKGIYNTFICPLNRISNTIAVCCYNIKLDYKETDSFLDLKLNKLELIYNPDRNSIINIDNYFTKVIVGAREDDLSGFRVNNIQDLTKPSEKGVAMIYSIQYKHVNQDTGIGTVTFYIGIPRSLPRNAELKISGDFSGLIIDNITPKCTVTTNSRTHIFGETEEDILNGDGIIESCNVNNIFQVKDTIIIKTKKIILRCGLEFSNKLFMILSPVQQLNWNVAPYNDYFYSMSIFTAESGEDLIYNNTAFKMPTIYFENLVVNQATTNTVETYKPNITKLWGNLCIVGSIFPRIPDELAYYDFSFDLDNTSGALFNQSPNEFSIFFPHQYYISNLSELKCALTDKTLSNLNINCYSNINGILNIRFERNVVFGKGQRLNVRIFGIVNPYLKETISFACTINNIDYLGRRKNLVTGSGSLIGGIDHPTNSNNSSIIIGNLKVINKESLSDTNKSNVESNNTINSLLPRIEGRLSLAISFDRASGTSIPSSLTNYPILIITMPTEYRLYDYNRFSITASIYIWTSIENSSIQQKTAVNLSIKEVTVYYNSIVIYFNDASITIESNFSSFDVTLNNVPSPPEKIESTSVFKVLFTNSNREYLFKTFTNLNTMSTIPLTNKVDNFIAFSRGLAYSFDYSKHIPEIIESYLIRTEPSRARLAIEKKNTLQFSPGKYFEYSFSILRNSLLLQISTLNIYLVNNNFSLGESSYTVTPGVEKTLFLIGTSCYTSPGFYVVFFDQNNRVNYTPLPQIVIIIKNIEIDYIEFTYPRNLQPGGSAFIYYDLPIRSYDDIIINWEETYSTNDSTAIISSSSITSSSKINKSVFTIFNQEVKSTQYFSSLNPNYCFHLRTNDISIGLTMEKAKYKDYIDNPTKLKDLFEFATADTLHEIKMNSIRVTFKPPKELALSYIYCIIVCFFDDFPTNIEEQDFTEFYHQGFVKDFDSDYDFDFKGLMRGMRYKIQCLLTTNESNKSSRDRMTVEFTTMKNKTTKFNSVITTPEIAFSQCIEYTFSEDPGYLLKINLLNKCQSLFSNGSDTRGCVKCVDDYGNLITGNSFKNVNRCTNSIQNISESSYTMNIKKNPLETKDVYNICAVVDYFCTEDLLFNFSRTLNEFSYRTSTSILLSEYLNFPLVDVENITRKSDATKPNISKLIIKSSEKSTKGKFSWKLENTGNALFCYWKIYEVVTNVNSSTHTATFEELYYCDSKSDPWCGTVQINSLGAEISSKDDNLKSMYPSVYDLWMVCYNDLPYFKTRSEVFVLEQFEIKREEVNVTIEQKVGVNYLIINYILIILVFCLIL